MQRTLMLKSVFRNTIGIFLLFIAASGQFAYAGGTATCAHIGDQYIKIGVPQRYWQLVDRYLSGTNKITLPNLPDIQCFAFVKGVDYQILDWLENRKIDAAIVNGVARDLLRSTFDSDQRYRQYFEEFAQLPVPVAALADTNTVIRKAASSRPLTLSAFSSELTDLFGKTARYIEHVLAECTSQPDDLDYKFVTDFASLRVACGLVKQPHNTFAIYIDSHLSPGLQEVFSLLAGWVSTNTEMANPAAKKILWQIVLSQIHFSATRQDDAASDDAVYYLKSSISKVPLQGSSTARSNNRYADIFVSRKGLLPRQGDINTEDNRYCLLNNWLNLRYQLAGRDDHCTLADPLVRFFDRNFLVREIGSRKQHLYRFNIKELWGLLDSFEAVPPSPYALVLSGGGVKAAYQSTIMDFLYNEHYLVNSFAEKNSSPPARPYPLLPVKHVIGTSGGALLGMIVASLNGNAANLTDVIWRKNQDAGASAYLDHTNIFPLLELPRYLASLAAVVILILVSFIYIRLCREKSLERSKLPARVIEPDVVSRFWVFNVPWVVLFIVTPWLLKVINGEGGLEHVPGTAGIFYTLFAIIGIYADNRFRIKTKARIWRFPKGALVLFILGTVLVVYPLVIVLTGSESVLTQHIGDNEAKISRAALLACFGLSFLYVALLLFYSAQDQFMEKLYSAKYLVSLFGLLFAIPVVAQFLLWLLGTTIFELTWDFWKQLMLVAALLSMIVVGIDYYLIRRGRVSHIYKQIMDILYTEHPAKTVLFRAKRYFRIFVLFFMCWTWWNLVSAPAIYGNDIAKGYFEEVVSNFERSNGNGGAGACGLDLKTYFIAPVTSLARNRDLYFLFTPTVDSASDSNHLSLFELPLPIRKLVSDPRWIVVNKKPETEYVRDIAFASGSPFPVFPAKKIDLNYEEHVCQRDSELSAKNTERAEWLVDGGYAHNIPIEAANSVGASRILVVSASPVAPVEELLAHQRRVENNEFSRPSLGKLFLNSQRLIPYLYGRSQIQDVLSTQGTIVATIAPSTIGEKKWPVLTDFRASVVKRMINAAENDIDFNRRIGMIESWGSPLCQTMGGSGTCSAL